MNFTINAVVMAITSLFGLAFILVGVLQKSSNQRSQSRGRKNNRQSTQPIAVKTGLKKGPFHHCSTWVFC